MQWYTLLRTRLFSLSFQLRYGIASLVGISVLLVAMILITLSVQAHFQEVLTVQQVRSQAAAREIESYIYGFQRKLGYLGRVQGFTTLPVTVQQTLIEGLTRQNEAYEVIAVLNSERQIQATTSAYDLELLPQSPEVKMAFEQAFYQEVEFIGLPKLIKISNQPREETLPVVLLGVPIHNQQDEVDGVLLAYVNLKFLWTLIQHTQVGKTGYAYIVDTQNRVIAQSHQVEENYQIQALASVPLVKTIRTMAGHRLNILHESRSDFYVGLQRKWVIGAATPIAGVNWLTVVEIPLKEVTIASYQLLLVMLVALMFVIAIAALSSMFFARKVIRPLKHLTHAAATLSSGNLNVQVPISRCAELGLLAQAFNRMAEHLRQMVRDLRTAKQTAEDTLIQLKTTQAQLVQSEKLSGLGQMMAGIAHEINNPVTFIYTNADYLNTYIQDLVSLVELYQSTYPDTNPLINQKLEAIEFEFLREDIFKILHSMTVGAERITTIVNSLRVFSRLDESGTKPVNLHDGIDSTLMVLNSRLNGTSKRPAIEVIKDYGSLPPVTCDAGQLNQVFMNILINAIDALAEEKQAVKRTRKEKFTPTISIRTQTSPTTVTITIADNGPGIPEEHKPRIFDPFFTTKPVGKGTGLGLSISYQIVTEIHNGSLECISELGLGTVFKLTLPITR